ncbi:hypothetical protein GCM10008179_29310 [Hansschlegelia plantiphila]|uniref:GGDEF domain-containing protein n=1 Tax=Hansschlegelia plantiphila TaxID=374655 RepID=A0A9W6J4U3_9HYPH|nr:hypothetical protein GCM10008179_29310 [Hansschlegelia plantiphila]
MFASALVRSSAGFSRLLSLLSLPELALPLCYAAALGAGRLLGEGPGEHPALALGAPVAIGMLLRFGRGLDAADIAGLAAAHVGVALILGDQPSAWPVALASDLIEIGCGSLIFLWLRRAGFLTSQKMVAAAAAAAAILGPLAATPLDVLTLAGPLTARLSAAGAGAFADAVTMGFVVALILSFGRGRGLDAPCEHGADDERPRAWEFVASSLLIAALVLGAAADSGPMWSLAASVALLWFALRLGLNATSIAAFSFFTALLAFAQQGQWRVLLEPAPATLSADLLRYGLLALLGGPSVIVAAVVHDQRRLKRLFAYRAMHDGLTKLVNRTRFAETLDSASTAARLRGRRFVLFLIDLDHFKGVNDTYGHARGDQLLIEVASRLRQSVRETDVVARIGGDEFAIVAPVSAVADAMGMAKRLVSAVNEVCDLEGVEVRPSITVGGVLAPDSSTNPRDLMLLADEAMYEAKRAGRNCWRFSSAEREGAPYVAWGEGDLALAKPETLLVD